jgi:hypothetical protein
MDDACFADRGRLACAFDDPAVLTEIALNAREGPIAIVDTEQRNWISVLAALRDAKASEQESR